MNIEFEHHYQQKLLEQEFAEETVLATAEDIQQWRSQWMEALKSWHSPYKTLVNCSNLKLDENEDLKKSLELMLKVFGNLFMKKIIGYYEGKAPENINLLPFDVFPSKVEALKAIGVRDIGARSNAKGDFRSQIALENNFRQHTVELSFRAPVTIDSPEKVEILKSKLTNNLMQWHSKWNLAVDCSQVRFSKEVFPEFEKLLRFLSGFFMKKIIGFSGLPPKENWPFEVYRSRHKAMAILEGEGNLSGDEADCRSKSK